MKKVRKRYAALFLREKTGGFSVSVPELPGCFSQGENFEEAVSNIHEAIDLYLEDVDPKEVGLYKPHQAEEQFLTMV